jgi:hypothetical protein
MGPNQEDRRTRGPALSRVRHRAASLVLAAVLVGICPGAKAGNPALGLEGTAVQPSAPVTTFKPIVGPTGKIPRTRPRGGGAYKTWSLFLMCVPGSSARKRFGRSRDIAELYEDAERFGGAIGPDHVAVWFWKSEMSIYSKHLASNVDFRRSRHLCHAFNLEVNGGPYLIVTNKYPKESSPPSEFAVFTLAQMGPRSIGDLLADVSRRLLEGEYNKPPAAGREGALWVRLLDAVQQAMGKFGCAWTFKVYAQPLSAQFRPCSE